MTPEELLRENRRRAQQAAQSVGVERMRKILERAQSDLNRAIASAEGLKGSGKESFTAVRARLVLRQVEDVLGAMRPKLKKLLVDQAVEVTDARVADTLRYIEQAERLFTGVSTPLGISQAAVLDHVQQGTEASVLRRIEADPRHPGRPGVLARYGQSVIAKFEAELQQRALTGKPWADVRAQLVKDSPFLQQAPAFWAERIVRTEAMAASNRGSQEAMTAANEQLGGDMLKVLCASFDGRTSWDSYQVHGQVRRVSEPFNDWQHAYAHPPNRPNDRETVVPHRASWPLPKGLLPKSDAEVAAAWAKEGRKGSPPARPLMSTVNLKAMRSDEELRRAEAERQRKEADLQRVEANPPKEPAAKPTVEPKPVLAPEPSAVVEAPVIRTPRFSNEGARSRHAMERLFEIPTAEALPIPGLPLIEFIRHPLRSHSQEVGAEPPWKGAQQRVESLSNKLRSLESAGNAPPLRQVRIDQVVALTPDVSRENIAEAINNARVGNVEAPIVVRYRGTLYAQENLEAIIAARLGERRTVQAHVIDLGARHPWPEPVKKPEPEPIKKPEPGPVATSDKPKLPLELIRNKHLEHIKASKLRINTPGERVFDEAASKVFPKGMPSIESLQKVWGSDEAGHTIKIIDAQAFVGRFETTVRFEGEIRSGDREIGRIIRTFKRLEDGTFEVHHDFFKLDDTSEQGKKGGSTMLRQSIQAYGQIGVNEVTVDAAWVGRYTWATFGYNWDKSYAPAIAMRLEVFLKDKGVEAKRASTIASQVSGRAWDVAALDVDGITVSVWSEGKEINCKLGKAFLLGEQMWSGKIVLDPNHETYKRAKERVGL